MKRDLILSMLSTLGGVLGVFFSVVTFLVKKNAEKLLYSSIKKHQLEFEKIIDDVNKSLLEIEKIKSQEKNYKEKLITMDQFYKLKSEISSLANELDDKQRKAIFESLDQSSLKGQIDYMNKLLVNSGSIEPISIRSTKIDS